MKFAEAEKLKVEVHDLREQLAAKEEELTKIKSTPAQPPSPIKPIVGSRVYVSYAVGSEVEKLVERKVKRLLEALEMSVITSKKDPSVTQDLAAAVKNSDIVLAVLTKDIKREEEGKVSWSPTHYVVEDVKAATGKKVILVAEQGVDYLGEMLEGAYVLEFRKDDPADMVVDLTAILRRLELAKAA